ncbi:glycerophosphodiester phosphodiesterase [Miniphocaeibacter massiliensis]|uniref:glycerophosphodiester phosphodiesterase n=1 Tax=Miniphocaeibacter massiliensis TaxID=2041841 RepID=UPI000C1B8B51|nr:glycerophosphodiester phosphodiesterase [Miniphocaeibacter massiliensis]
MKKIFAHRGSKGTHPENTFASIKEAVKVGADGIEIDVHLSKDRKLIVIHDETVDRTTNGRGYIKDMTLEEIKELDAGSWFDEKYKDEKIPTIDELLELLNELKFKGTLNIEIKTDKIKYRKIERYLAKTLLSKDLKFDYLYSSFNIKSLKRIHFYDRKAKKAWLVKGISNKKEEISKLEKDRRFEGLHPNVKAIKDKEKFIENFPKNIRVWTVNNEEDMKYCFSKKLEAVITDYPEIAIKIKNGIERKI